MHYAASKAGLIALSKSVAVTYAGSKIYSYSISPGCVNTKMMNSIEEQTLSNLRKEIPTGDFVDPQEIADTVIFLCSYRVKNATGSSFDINGGSYLR